MEGDGSLTITPVNLLNTATAQGDGVEIELDDFALADRGRLHTITFDYNIPDNGISANGDFQLFLLDYTNGRVIRVNNSEINVGRGTHYATVFIPEDTVDATLLLHFAADRPFLYFWWIDRIRMAPVIISNQVVETANIYLQAMLNGTGVSANTTTPFSFPDIHTENPTGQWDGTTFTALEDGPILFDISIKSTASTTTNVAAYIDRGDGNGFVSYQYVGTFVNDSLAETFLANMERGHRLQFRPDASTGMVGNRPDINYIKALKVGSRQVTYQGFDGEEVIVEGEATALSSSDANTGFTFNNTIRDTHNAWDGQTFVAPSDGVYLADVSIFGNNLGNVYWYLNRNDGAGWVRYKHIGEFTGGAEKTTIFCLLTGEQLQLRSFTANNLSANRPDLSYIKFVKLVVSAPQLFGGGPVHAKYTSSNGQSVTIGNPIAYEERVADSHNGFNNGVYTVQFSGIYNIVAAAPNTGADYTITLTVTRGGTAVIQTSVSTMASDIVPVVDNLRLEAGDQVSIIPAQAYNLWARSDFTYFSIAKIGF